MRSFSFFFILLFSLTGFSLESSDILSTQILKIYDKNILVLNRGLEDAIFKADHGKLTSDDGFIARGICIKTTLQTSHWKIYRVVRPQLVSKDTVYKLHSINQSEMPPSLVRFSKVDFSKYYNDVNDKTQNKQLELQVKRVARFDLPNNAKNTDAYKEMTESKYDSFINENFSNEVLKKDLSNSYLNIFASPLSWQSRYDQKEIHYGFNFYNIAERFQFQINSIETQRKIVDPVTENGITSKSSHHDFQFQFNRITDHFSIISFVEYDKEKIGNIYYPYDHYKVGVLGGKIHIMESEAETSLVDISYTPVFDNIQFTNPAQPNSKLLKRDGLRHYFKLRIFGRLSPHLLNRTEIVYAPFVEMGSSDYEFNDTYVHASSLFSYDLGGRFFWDYLIEYENDELRGEVYAIQSENTKQTIRFRYQFDL